MQGTRSIPSYPWRQRSGGLSWRERLFPLESTGLGLPGSGELDLREKKFFRLLVRRRDVGFGLPIVVVDCEKVLLKDLTSLPTIL